MVKTQSRRKFGTKVRQKTLRTKKKVLDPAMAAGWDESKTMGENYRALGLETNPNRDIVPSAAAKGVGGSAGGRRKRRRAAAEGDDAAAAPASELKVEAFKNIDSAKNISGQHTTNRTLVTEEVHKVVAPLIRKYGEDYAKMARDIKLNPFQHTAAQLRRICTRVPEALK